jgi:integrase/recombinase XerD
VGVLLSVRALSVSGLRLSDARNLELHDVDLKAALLTIRGANFGKTRLRPLHASTCTVLAAYLRRRQRHWWQRLVSSYVFVCSWGHRLDGGDIHRTFFLSTYLGYVDVADIQWVSKRLAGADAPSDTPAPGESLHHQFLP